MNPFHTALSTSPPLTLEPATTALLVVDMQYFDAHPDWGEGRTAKEVGVAHLFDAYFAQIDAVIPRIQTLLVRFRQQGIEVIHVRVAELTNDSRDVGLKQLVRGLVVPASSREADPLDELAPVGDELVVSKSSSGVFPVTNLDRLLRNMGITTLLFTGTATGGCIESAVRDATDLGYDVGVIDDACACSTPESHAAALARMAGGLTHILSTEAVLQQVESLPRNDRQVRSGLERVKAYLPQPPSTSENAEDDGNPYASIFPPAQPPTLVANRCALVLVDVQRFCCEPEYTPAAPTNGETTSSDHATAWKAYYERINTMLTNLPQLLAACRANGILVIHVRTASQLRDSRDLSRKLRAQGLQLWQGSATAAIMSPVEPTAEELILNKPASGIFTGTGLDELCRNIGIDQLILTGASFDGALEGSLRSATDRGYRVLLVPDACAVGDEPSQQRLWTLESGILAVRSTVEALSLVKEAATIPSEVAPQTNKVIAHTDRKEH